MIVTFWSHSSTLSRRASARMLVKILSAMLTRSGNVKRHFRHRRLKPRGMEEVRFFTASVHYGFVVGDSPDRLCTRTKGHRSQFTNQASQGPTPGIPQRSHPFRLLLSLFIFDNNRCPSRYHNGSCQKVSSRSRNTVLEGYTSAMFLDPPTSSSSTRSRSAARVNVPPLLASTPASSTPSQNACVPPPVSRAVGWPTLRTLTLVASTCVIPPPHSCPTHTRDPFGSNPNDVA